MNNYKYIFIKTVPDLEGTPGKALTLDPLAVPAPQQLTLHLHPFDGPHDYYNFFHTCIHLKEE